MQVWIHDNQELTLLVHLVKSILLVYSERLGKQMHLYSFCVFFLLVLELKLNLVCLGYQAGLLPVWPAKPSGWFDSPGQIACSWW